jgi:hypothetical protein
MPHRMLATCKQASASGSTCKFANDTIVPSHVRAVPCCDVTAKLVDSETYSVKATACFAISPSLCRTTNDEREHNVYFAFPNKMDHDF